MPECCDKGGLLPLPSVYDYQYVLGHHHRAKPQQAMTGLKQTMFLLHRGKALSKDAHPLAPGQRS